MSPLFFRVSWPSNVDKFRRLQIEAKDAGLSLRVKNVSRVRGVPVFLFFLSRAGEDLPKSYHDLDHVASALRDRSPIAAEVGKGA